MLDSNSISQLSQAAPAVQQSIVAWVAVGSLVSGIIVHAGHMIIGYGGIKGIANKIWNGNSQSASGTGVPPVSPQSGQEAPK